MTTNEIITFESVLCKIDDELNKFNIKSMCLPYMRISEIKRLFMLGKEMNDYTDFIHFAAEYHVFDRCYYYDLPKEDMFVWSCLLHYAYDDIIYDALRFIASQNDESKKTYKIDVNEMDSYWKEIQKHSRLGVLYISEYDLLQHYVSIFGEAILSYCYEKCTLNFKLFHGKYGFPMKEPLFEAISLEEENKKYKINETK